MKTTTGCVLSAMISFLIHYNQAAHTGHFVGWTRSAALHLPLRQAL
ncbi:hypothetical protein [Litoribacillus peritrichatus]